MEQEKWINEILESTNDIKMVAPNSLLFSQIESRIASEKVIAPQWVWLAAASILLLIALNIKFVFCKSFKQENETEQLASSISKSNQLY